MNRLSPTLLWLMWREMLRFTALWTSAALAVFYIGDVFENLDTYLEAGASGLEVLSLFVLRTPELLIQAGPLVVALAALTFVGRFAATNEVTATEALGLSPKQVYAVATSVAVLFMAGHGVYHAVGIEKIARRTMELERDLGASSAMLQTDQPYVFAFEQDKMTLIERDPNGQMTLVAHVEMANALPQRIEVTSDRTYVHDLVHETTAVEEGDIAQYAEQRSDFSLHLPIQMKAVPTLIADLRAHKPMLRTQAIEELGTRSALWCLPILVMWVGLRRLQVHGRGAGGFATLSRGLGRAVGSWALVVAATVLAAGKGHMAWGLPWLVILTMIVPWGRIKQLRGRA